MNVDSAQPEAPSQPPLVARRLDGSALLTGILAASILVAANSAYVASFLGFIHEPASVLENDHYYYIAMADNAGDPSLRPLAFEAPYAYRIALPWLAGTLSSLGLELDTAFYLCSQLFLTLFLATLYLYLLSVGLERRYALLGIALTALLQGAVRWYAYQYWMTDPPALFLITLAFYLIQRERFVALVAVSVVGVAVRETYCLVFVYYLLHQLKRGSARSAIRDFALVTALPALFFILLRGQTIVSTGPALWEVIQGQLHFRWQAPFDNQLYFCTVGSFGVLLPLVFLDPRELVSRIGKHFDEFAVVAIVFLSLAAADNTDRLLAYALPVVLPMAMRSLRSLVSRSPLSFSTAATLTLVVQLYLYVETEFYGVPAISINQPFNLSVSIVMGVYYAGCAGLLIFARRRAGAA